MKLECSAAVIFVILVASADSREDRVLRHSLEWKTTDCAVIDGEQTEPCPSPGISGAWPCIRYSDLCNGLRDCPNGEDESPEHCHFHQLQRAELDSIRRRLHRIAVELHRRTAASF